MADRDSPPGGKFIILQSMISALEFLSELEKKGLLPEELLAGVRQLILHGQERMTAADVAQLLIDEGYLTNTLADHLLGELEKQTTHDIPESIKGEGREEEIGFAQIKEEPQPRIHRGPLRAHKLDEAKKEQPHKPSPQDSAKPQQPSPSAIAKKTLLDKPSSSPWAASVYERETDSYKGLVSYRLSRLAEAEEKHPPPPLTTEKNRRPIWIGVLIAVFLLLVSAIVYILLR